jgi:hypothetical protein
MALQFIESDLSLPELGAPDVTKREITIEENGVLKQTLVRAGATLKDKLLTIRTSQDVEIGVTLRDYDDATPTPNVSDPVQLVFRAVDASKPIITGGIDLIGSREVFEDEPAPEVPVVEEPAPEVPVVEEPVVEEPAPPVVEEPVVETPVVEEPVVETPVVEEPAPVEPTPEVPVVEEPVVEVPVVEEPAPEAPQEPVVSEPVLEVPAEEPAPEAPAEENPSEG